MPVTLVFLTLFLVVFVLRFNFARMGIVFPKYRYVKRKEVACMLTQIVLYTV